MMNAVDCANAESNSELSADQIGESETKFKFNKSIHEIPKRYDALNLLPSGICVVDRKGRILFVNNAWRDFAIANGGVAQSKGGAFLGHSYIDVCLGAVGAEAPEAAAFGLRLMKLLDRGDERHFCVIYPCHSAVARRWFRAAVTLIDEGAIISHDDVTDDHTRRDDPDGGLVTAEIVHDLRSPLTAILGFADIVRELVERNGNHAKMLECVAHIRQSGYRMMDVVEELMRDAEAAFHDRENDTSRVTLDDLVGEVLIQVTPKAQEGSVTPVWVPSSPPIRLLGENHGLWKVVTNLVTNAVKYNRVGGTVHLTTEINAIGGVELTVSDSGIGMAQADLVRMFQPFARGNGTARRREGNGVGLAVVREIAHRHDAMVRVSSAPGVGTTITLVFPKWRTVAVSD